MATTTKEQPRELLDEASDDAGVGYRDYVRRKLVRAMEDIEAGKTVSHEEVKRQAATW